MTPAQENVLEQLRGGPKTPRNMGRPGPTQHTLDSLFRRNLVTLRGGGLWELTPRGRKKLGIETAKRPNANVARDLRRETGVTVTLREQQTRQLVTLVREGRIEEALLDVCASADKAHGDWKVVTISTPQTIERDLNGTRNRNDGRGVSTPEQIALARIGRTDMLER